MAYLISPKLADGQPELEIMDATTGSVRMSWKPAERHGRDSEIHRLFRELFLMTALDELKRP